MNTGTSFHIYHGNVKFIMRRYLSLLQNSYEFEEKNDNFTINIRLEKKSDATWNDITQRSYGKKALRFIHRNNGLTGIWLVARVTRQTVIEKAKRRESICRTSTVGDLTYSYTITISPEIINEIHERLKSRSHQMHSKQEKQRSEAKKNIEYTCYNPKPYQGGGFSSK